jgi:hypothetical protein
MKAWLILGFYMEETAFRYRVAANILNGSRGKP